MNRRSLLARLTAFLGFGAAAAAVQAGTEQSEPFNGRSSCELIAAMNAQIDKVWDSYIAAFEEFEQLVAKNGEIFNLVDHQSMFATYPPTYKFGPKEGDALNLLPLAQRMEPLASTLMSHGDFVSDGTRLSQRLWDKQTKDASPKLHTVEKDEFIKQLADHKQQHRRYVTPRMVCDADDFLIYPGVWLLRALQAFRLLGNDLVRLANSLPAGNEIYTMKPEMHVKREAYHLEVFWYLTYMETSPANNSIPFPDLNKSKVSEITGPNR